MSGIITEPIFLKTFPQMEQNNKSGAIQALVVAIDEIGCLIGALGIVGYGDKLGRRRAILTGAGIMIVGAILQTASTGKQTILVAVGNSLLRRWILVDHRDPARYCYDDCWTNRDGKLVFFPAYYHKLTTACRASATA